MSTFYQRSISDSDESDLENTYCIFLHIVEGVGLQIRESGDFDRQKQIIMLHASLNGVKFEVEGHSTETTTIFNSNCIWESDIENIKRMKTDNRPVKIECFICGRANRSSGKQIGTLLLPLRSLPLLNQLRNVQVKLLWHKLTGLTSAWRETKPELHLLLTVIKKCYVDNGQFEALLQKHHFGSADPAATSVSETGNMLQSQSNVYVQLLEQVGLIQVGNNPDIDCDIYSVSLTLKQIRDLERLNYNQKTTKHIVLSYDFLGVVSHLEIHPNESDCYSLNEKISLSFKTSLQSLRLYFQCIFYIPITLYINDTIMANYRFDFNKQLPDDAYFNVHKLWQKQDSFSLDSCASAGKPTVDFLFSMQLMQSYAKKPTDAMTTYRIEANTQLRPPSCDASAQDMAVTVAQHNYSSTERYIRDQSTLLALGAYQYESDELVLNKSSDDVIKVAVSQGTKSQESLPTNGSQYEEQCEYIVADPSTVSIGINTVESAIEVHTVPPTNHEELTLKVVQELEEWKKEQLYLFLKEMKRNEEKYWAQLNAVWEEEKKELQNKLHYKIEKCEELNSKLQHAYLKLHKSNDSEAYKLIKSEIEQKYASKFENLDVQMRELKSEVEKRSRTFDAQTDQLQQENADLMYENSQLCERIRQLEDRLHALNNNKATTEELKNVIEDLHTQRDRFAQVEKSRNYYKDEWIKSAQELNNLQLNILQKQQENFSYKKKTKSCISLEKVLQEDQVELVSERKELKSFREMLYNSSDSD